MPRLFKTEIASEANSNSLGTCCAIPILYKVAFL